MKSKITFLLPLFYGNYYLKRWLEQNYKKEKKFRYYFADGSGDLENFKILKKIDKINNFKYKKFKEDKIFPTDSHKNSKIFRTN